MATVTAEDGTSSTQIKGTTDCLNVDIYTQAEGKNLPVVVYVHGGNNQSGSTLEVTGNEIAVTNNCVFVSVNYRLGFLGYNSLPSLVDDETSGNFGLLDIAKSLKWVKENIENFGGNPNNVTISGFSAGGRNVMAMLISPAFENLFDKAIVYSGGMTIANLEDSATKTAEMMATLTIEDGKATTEEEATAFLLQDNDEVKEYLYSISEERLTKLMSNAGIRMALFPHLFGDDITLPSTGFEDAVYVNDVPVLMLTGTTEFSMFGTWDSYMNKIDESVKEEATAFEVKYGSEFYRMFNGQLSAAKMDDIYASDIYVCEIEYGGETSESNIPIFGSFHGIFIPMYNETNSYSKFTDFGNDGYQEMARIYNEYISNFIINGNPNGNDLTDWTPWTNNNRNTMTFDANSDSGQVTIGINDTFKSNMQIIEEMINDDSIDDDLKYSLITNVLNGRWFSSDLDNYFNTPSLW